MSKIFLAAAVATALLAQVAFAHDHHHERRLEDDFKECLCWNSTTNAFCNGPEWYDQEVCHKLARHALGFVPVALSGALLLVLCPLIFYCARVCCRCCGGRHSTRGCCCSDVSTRATFPGYKNRTIVCTKGWFFAVVIACIPVSIVLLSRNPQLHYQMEKSVDVVGDAGLGLTRNLTASANAATSLAVDGALSAPGLAPASLAEGAAQMSAAWAKYASTFDNVLEHVKRAESHGLFGRYAITYIVAASGLLILATTTLLALTNMRQLVGIMMIAMCFHTATLIMVQIPQHAAAVATELVCNTYDAVAVPIVVGQAKVNGLCGNAAVEAGLETTKDRTRAHLTESKTDFCRDYKLACEATVACVATPCDDASAYPVRVQRQPFAENPLDAVRNVDTLINILAAEGYSGQAQKDAVARLVQFQQSSLVTLETLFGTLYTVNHDCAAVADAMRGPINARLCNGNLNGRFQSVAGLMCALIPLSCFAALIMCLGMKRFRARNSFDMLRGAETDEAAPIMRGAPDTTLIVVAHVNRGDNGGALNDSDAVSGVVVDKEVAYVPSSSYGAADTYHKA